MENILPSVTIDSVLMFVKIVLSKKKKKRSITISEERTEV